MNGYNEGFPVMPGWYDCLVEGEQVMLKHYICQVSMKHKWIDKTGEYIHDKVYWRGQPKAGR